MTDSLFDAAGRELDAWLAPFATVAEDPERLDDLLRMAGIIVPDAQRAALQSAVTAISVLRTQLQGALSASTGSIERIAAVLGVARQLLAALRAMDSLAGSAPGLVGIGRDLADALLTAELSGRHPVLRSVLSLLALLDIAEDIDLRPPVVQNNQVLRNEFFVDRYHVDRIAGLFRDPAAALRAEYGNPLLTVADGNALADKLFPRVARALDMLGVVCHYGINPNRAEALGDAAPFLDHALIVYATDPLRGDGVEAGFVFTISPADRGDLGLVVQPFGVLTSTRAVGAWTLELELSAEVNILAVGRHGFTVLADASTAEVSGGITLTLPVPDDGTPAFVLGTPTGSRLEIAGAQPKAATSLSEEHQTLALSADVTKASLTIDGGDFDGFIGSVLPPDGIHADFDLGVAWSSDTGLRLRGSAGLDGTFPVGLSLGGVTVPSVHLAIRAGEGQLTAEVSASLIAQLGPIVAVVDRLGLTAVLAGRPDRDGNLGPLDAAVGFKPPTGVGLSVNAGVVTGGGFLSFDPVAGEYSGVLELQIADLFTLDAIELINTRMPDGSAGFSLLAVITADFGAGIQLGLGFKLLGVGGLVGLNRGMNLQALVEGVRTGEIEAVAFPRDIIANAPRILSDLNKFFPPRPGTFLIGPIAKIGWGTPTLINLTVGLIMEIPGNVAVVGVLDCVLPNPDEPLLVLRVDFLGALERDKSRLWFFATLFDSRIMAVPLDGGMGVLVGWGDNADLVVTVGGFHPSFRPPALPFPVPRRLSVDLLNQPGRLIRVSGYFAVTSNTVQFGAKAELRLSFSHFSIEGHLGFDALFQFSPFAFAVDISAGVSLKAFGVGVFGIDLRFRLEGPAPYRAHGRGSIGFLFFEISANFDITWGESRVTTLPPVPVLPLLAVEIGKVEGWATRLPTGGANPLVTLRQVGAAEGPVLHPLGTLTVRQRAIPLNVRVDRIGGQAASDGRRFGVALPLGSPLTPVSTTGDKFAMAQFQNMTDAQKLSRPSYEPQDAGVELTAKTGTLLASRVVRRSARYELHIIDGAAQPASGVLPPVTPRRFHDVHPAVFGELLRGSSTSRSPLSRREASLRQPFAAVDTVQVTDQRFVVAYVRSNLQALPPASLNSTRQPLVAAALAPTGTPATSFRSQTTAADALADWVGADPSLAGQLHVIPVAEAAAPPAREGTWSPAGILPTPASGVDAVRLASGKVLIAGGADPTGAALAGTALYDPAGNAWSAAGRLGAARRGHTTSRLLDGGVLAAGGTGDGGVLASAERFDPAAAGWARAAPMGTARAGHSATVLTNGSVLVAGGTGTAGDALSTVELFDPVEGTWSAGVPMTDARSEHQAVRLAGGRVLVVGGLLPGGDGSRTALAYCELYDPATGGWSPTGSLTTPRAGHQATLLPDGRVLVTGGEPVPAPDGTYLPHSLASAELYDPGTGTWGPAADMPGGRSRHRAVLVRTGVVLAIGGTRGPGFGGGYRSVFAYDPSGDTWAATGALALGRADLAVAELADQRLLVAGGIAATDPVQPEAAATGEVLIP